MPKILPEIEKYNAVGIINHEIPIYDATKAERKIVLYFNKEGDMLMAGWAGERYVFWLSSTKTEQEVVNAKLFHHVVYEELNYVAYFPKALASLGINMEELEQYYSLELHYETGVKLKKNEIPTWETPFGHLYRNDQIEQNGAKFAEDVKQCVLLQQERCTLREGGGSYRAVLMQYAKELEASDAYDNRVRLLEELLQKETYLCLSRDEETRQAYLYCIRRCRELKAEKKFGE